jgi:hypothetical protein
VGGERGRNRTFNLLPRSAIEELKWTNIEFQRKTIPFNRMSPPDAYLIPMADKRAMVKISFFGLGLSLYRREGQHIIGVKKEQARRIGCAIRSESRWRNWAQPHQARLLMGHSVGGEVSRGYIRAPLLVESLRPVANAAAEHYLKTAGVWNAPRRTRLPDRPSRGCYRR